MRSLSIQAPCRRGPPAFTPPTTSPTINHHNAPFGGNHIPTSYCDLHLRRFLNDHQIISAALSSLPSSCQSVAASPEEPSRHRYQRIVISSLRSWDSLQFAPSRLSRTIAIVSNWLYPHPPAVPGPLLAVSDEELLEPPKPTWPAGQQPETGTEQMSSTGFPTSNRETQRVRSQEANLITNTYFIRVDYLYISGLTTFPSSLFLHPSHPHPRSRNPALHPIKPTHLTPLLQNPDWPAQSCTSSSLHTV